jgi:hypothetical protein
MMISESKLRVYKTLVDLILKVIFAFFGLIAFIIVGIILCFEISYPAAIIETILTISVGRIYLHYFPVKKR